MGNKVTVIKSLVLSVSVQLKARVRFSQEKLPHTGKILREMKFTAERDDVQMEERLTSALGSDLKSLPAKIKEQACKRQRASESEETAENKKFRKEK